MPYKDKTKHKKLQQKWYLRNRDRIIQKSVAKIKVQRLIIRKWLDEFKANLQCSRCKENHPATLCFHHIDRSTKKTTISRAMHDGYSIEKILKEMAKCEVLCANCHAKEHWKQDLHISPKKSN